jgi:Mg-chelatase subunit ChlD
LLVSLIGTAGLGAGAYAQETAFAVPGAYGLKVYRVESGLYPFVQVYFRTFDENKRPLINLNERNVGVMVKGRSYNPMKGQYLVQSIAHREEPIRSVLVLDASGSMKGKAFDAAIRAAGQYVDSKRPQDEVAILAIRDTKEGYDVVSQFERDTGALARRLLDVRPDGVKTRLYDSVGAGMQMCGLASQGSVRPDLSSYVVSCAVVVLSDGHDEGSALSREELNTRISGLDIPIPVYSVAYSRKRSEYFKNLESISKNSFGLYYEVEEAYERMQRIVEEIQNILQNDYVVTFRSYIDPDGESYAVKVGVEYPTGSGKFTYENARFEAIEPPPVPELKKLSDQFDKLLPKLSGDEGPYFMQGGDGEAAAKPAKKSWW